MRRDAECMQALTLVWLLSCIPYSLCHSLPGKPRLTKCRSPEKETFSCWWEPGSSGGLPTSHHLYYRKEGSLAVFDCPDYHTAGNNSCHFDKRHTSIWIVYNITVVASNALGKTYSESVEVDVMDIVQPNPPENVNASVIQTEKSVSILVWWEPPRDADTRSGWVTIKYEIRIKPENSLERNSSWESYSAGKQLEFSIYSPQPGASYLIQVRCKLDQGLWSEWSPHAFIQIPDGSPDIQNAAMIFAVTLTVFLCALTLGVLGVRMKRVKRFLLPPVPQPKINGLDTKLLKNGKSEEIFSALIVQGFPQMAKNPEHQVEFLIVTDVDEVSDIKALLYKTGKISSADPPQKFPQNCRQIIQNSSEDLNGIPGHQYYQDCTLQSTPMTIHTGATESQHHYSANTHVREDETDCRVSITPAELTGYVEVDKEKQDQEDYSKISDIISDNILVLHKDTTPVQIHKEDKCDKIKCEMEDTQCDVEPLRYLKTVTSF